MEFNRLILQMMVFFVAVALLCGCAMVGPEYVKPTVPEPTDWLEKEDPKIKTEDIDYAQWWTVFNDPVLNGLVQTAYNQNLSLQAAALRILQARTQLAIARENEEIQRRSFELAETRFKAGAVTELDVAQARSLLTNTQSTILAFEQTIRQSKNALAILLDKLPGEIDAMLEGAGVISKVPEGVAVGIPAELLRRRPDIRFAERNLAAQSARIGVARADLYPHLQLFGSLGFFTTDANNTRAGGGIGGLFDGDSFSSFGGTGIRWDILNYGRINNRVRVQDSALQELIVTYENTVLEAAQEAEDGIVALLRTQEQEILACPRLMSTNWSKPLRTTTTP